ncbi:hypothetical protein Tco_0352789 [Tanacetum coccineum]
MDNSGRNNVVYSLVQRDGNVRVRRHHEKGFWSDVFANFDKDIGGTIREYDAIVSKWKNSIRPKAIAFIVVYDGVQRMDENRSSDLAGSGVDLEVEALKAEIARWAYNSSYISVCFTRSYTIRTPSSAANVNVGFGDVSSFKDEILKLQKGREDDNFKKLLELFEDELVHAIQVVLQVVLDYVK